MEKIMILFGVDRFMVENNIYFIFKKKGRYWKVTH